jgi:hypothetical protein
MRHPAIADAAYLALKPAEYGAAVTLRLCFPHVVHRIRSLY